MYSAQVKNTNGETLSLTGNESCWQVLSIGGLNPAPATVNLTNIAGMDGSKFNSSKLNTRNLVIMLRLNGNVEENRLNLYRFFRTKENVIFYYQNGSRDVSIAGIVETVECDLFSRGEIMQISIICPYPYFKSIYEVIVDISNQAAMFTFPFSINSDNPIPFSSYLDNRITNVPNRSEAETGVKIEIDILAAVEKIEIANTDTGETMTLVYTFQEGDRVVIDTEKGSKSILLIREGVTSNLFTAMSEGSSFFQLKVGDNHFTYSVDSGAHDADVFILFRYNYQFRGV